MTVDSHEGEHHVCADDGISESNRHYIKGGQKSLLRYTMRPEVHARAQPQIPDY